MEAGIWELFGRRCARSWSWPRIALCTGVWGYYYDNGQLQQKERYRNGKPIGTWKSFDREGKLIAEHWYGNGIKVFDMDKQQNYVGSGSIKVKNPNKQ